MAARSIADAGPHQPNFTLKATGEVTDNHLGLIFVNKRTMSRQSGRATWKVTHEGFRWQSRTAMIRRRA
jgi:hypothetical protein